MSNLSLHAAKPLMRPKTMVHECALHWILFFTPHCAQTPLLSVQIGCCYLSLLSSTEREGLELMKAFRSILKHEADTIKAEHNT